MVETVTFRSDDLELSGALHIPEGLAAGEKRPAIIVMHGFGGHKSGPAQLWSAPQFTDWGYVVLRFDFRGCGGSEGPPGRVIPAELIADARAAIDFITTRDEVDTPRIAFSGTSYGAVTAICATAADDRISAVIAQGGWGNGAKWFRFLHPPGAAWDKFQAMLKRGRDNLGSSSPEMVHRFDIVPIPDHLRANIAGPSAFDFQVDTAVATYAFNPEDYVARVAPRPLMLIHAAHDGVVPASGSVDLFENSGEGAELYIMTDTDHFMFGEDNPRVVNLVKDWLGRFFPVQQEATP